MDSKEVRNRFNYRSLDDKASLVTNYGHHLAIFTANHGKYTINLYHIDNFFVEVFYNTGTKRIDQIWMPSFKELDDYMGSISLQYLGFKV